MDGGGGGGAEARIQSSRWPLVGQDFVDIPGRLLTGRPA